MAEITDLLNAASNGDGDSEAKAFYQLEPELRKIARARLRNFEAPDPDRPRPISTWELVEMAFAKTINQTVRGQQAEWRFRGHFLKFAARKMGWLLLDELRKPLKLPLEKAVAVEASEEDVSDLVAAREELGRLNECVDNLEPGYRLPVQCHFFLEMKVAAVAVLLEIAEKTVYDRLRRAKELLRECLQDPEFDF